MGTVLLLKEIERNDQPNTAEGSFLQQPAVILDFNQKFQANLLQKNIQRRAMDGIQVLRVILSDYEKLMKELAQNISPEQLAKITQLSAEEQILEDVRRLNDLIQALESKILAQKGLNLRRAMEDLQKQTQQEVGNVAAYLESNEYPLFKVWVKVIEWTSLDLIDSNEIELTMKHLEELGALDTANVLVFL